MREFAKTFLSITLLVAAIFPLWACGQTFEVTITSNGVTATGSVELEGEVTTFTSVVGPGGTVSWDINGCSGSVSGLQPGAPCTVTCKDPLLMQWPDNWTFLGGTWTDLGGGAGSGAIIVEPAGLFLIEPVHGPITNDPGNSSWLARLDIPNLGPTIIGLTMTFDVSANPNDCVKGFDVALVTHTPDGARYLVPQEGLPLDFTALPPGDPHVACVTSVIPSMNTLGLGILMSVLALMLLVTALRVRRSNA